MKKTKFRAMEHMADIKYEVMGSSIEEIFESSALAFSSYISSGKKIGNDVKKKIKIKGNDIQSLLYMFLEEMIYQLDACGFCVSSAKVSVKGNTLDAILIGDSTKDYHLNHIKAATYHDMSIWKDGKTWKAQFILDV